MTTPGARARCPECGAQLRRGRQPGQRCDPCQRTGPRIVLPEAFYDQPDLEAALAGFDFGTVFRAVRAAQHWSQEALAEFLHWEQRRISAIETGKRALLDLRIIVRVANQLAIPAGKLGFAHGITVGLGTTTGRKGSWVDRRDFVQHVAGLTLGTGVTGLDIDRLTALLPQADPTGTRHIGPADVEAIEQATAAFRRQDFTQGSGLSQAAAVAQLQSVLPLLDAQTRPDVRLRLLVATADLALQAGYMSFEVMKHEAARRLWIIGLDIARAAEDPPSSDLTVYLLYDMALQAVQLGRPAEALRLVHLGHATATDTPAASAATISCLANIQARAPAAQGDAMGCDRALGQAVERISTIDAATTPPWSAHIRETGASGLRGVARYTLALTNAEPNAAGLAVSLLRQAVDTASAPATPGSGRCTCPTLPGPRVGRGHRYRRHRRSPGCRRGHGAALPRAYDRLRVLNTALEPLHTSPGVAELRERLVTTAA
ncbi:MAG TPA: helix-turn-helix domain-containing protein [Pseudonocardiaceae bacterium]|nr:helix-turn-helix domain-containing protein [Pseudonocardiaceae bacterium]